MKVTVRFSQVLSKKLQVEDIVIDVNSYRDVIEACQNLIPGIKKVIQKRLVLALVCAGKVVKQEELDFKISSTDLIIVPSVAGGATSSFDSLGNLNIFYGASKAYSTEEMGLSGLNRRILDSSLFGQAETAFDVSQRKSSRDDGTLEGNEDPTTGFGTLNIVSVYGQPIPLHFGMVRVGGAVINSYIKHIQRGGVDSVRVSDYV